MIANFLSQPPRPDNSLIFSAFDNPPSFIFMMASTSSNPSMLFDVPPVTFASHKWWSSFNMLLEYQSRLLQLYRDLYIGSIMLKKNGHLRIMIQSLSSLLFIGHVFLEVNDNSHTFPIIRFTLLCLFIWPIVCLNIWSSSMSFKDISLNIIKLFLKWFSLL